MDHDADSVQGLVNRKRDSIRGVGNGSTGNNRSVPKCSGIQKTGSLKALRNPFQAAGSDRAPSSNRYRIFQRRRGHGYLKPEFWPVRPRWFSSSLRFYVSIRRTRFPSVHRMPHAGRPRKQYKFVLSKPGSVLNPHGRA